MGSAAAGEPAEEVGGGGLGLLGLDEAAEGEGVDPAGRVVEGEGGAGAEEGGDGGDESGGGGGIGRVVGEGRGDVADMAEDQAVDGAWGGAEALDHGGQGWA